MASDTCRATPVADLIAREAMTRSLECRLRRWRKTGQFCPTCRARRGGRAR